MLCYCNNGLWDRPDIFFSAFLSFSHSLAISFWIWKLNFLYLNPLFVSLCFHSSAATIQSYLFYWCSHPLGRQILGQMQKKWKKKILILHTWKYMYVRIYTPALNTYRNDSKLNAGFYIMLPFPTLIKALHLIPMYLEYVSCLTISKAYSYLWEALNGLYS